MPLAKIEDAIADFRQGRFVIIVDDENRENEGDLAMAAEKVTPEAINFMARHGRGLICLAIAGRRLDELQIPLMVQENTSPLGTVIVSPACVISRWSGATTRFMRPSAVLRWPRLLSCSMGLRRRTPFRAVETGLG